MHNHSMFDSSKSRFVIILEVWFVNISYCTVISLMGIPNLWIFEKIHRWYSFRIQPFQPPSDVFLMTLISRHYLIMMHFWHASQNWKCHCYWVSGSMGSSPSPCHFVSFVGLSWPRLLQACMLQQMDVSRWRFYKALSVKHLGENWWKIVWQVEVEQTNG